MGEWEPLLITLHSLAPHWEYLQCFKLLENVSRIVWPCASLTRILWFQLMWSDFLAPLGFWMRSGNTRLSLSVNLTTLSKENSGCVWKGCVWHTSSNSAAAVEYTASTGGPGSRCPQLLSHHLPCYFTPVPDTSCLAHPGFIFKLSCVLEERKGKWKKHEVCLWARQA